MTELRPGAEPDARPDAGLGLGPHAAELALAAAAGAGDPTACERFARRALPIVRRVARAIIADPTEAEDALQQALIEVLEAAGSYRGSGPLDAWVRTVASRVVLRHARRARSSRLRADVESPEALGQAPAATPMLDALPRPLEHYLHALPEPQRMALVLRHALGHTIPEISELTEAPEPTVVSRIKKAREQLRRLIQRDVNLGASPPRTS